MPSDKKSVVKQPKGNALSTFLVVAAVAAAGGVGHFLWKFQARLNDGSSAAAATAVQPVSEPDAPLDPNNKVARALNELQAPRVQNAPRLIDEPAVGAPIPIVSGGKSVRGGISIVGKNGAVSGVAPATAADLRSRDDYAGPSYGSSSPGDGPRIYTSRDPNLDLAQPSYRSGRPRYYDFETGRSRASDYNWSTQRATTVRQGSATGGN